jgi:hypothetical protein
VFVKADSASTTRVVVTLPAYKLLPFLRSRQGQAQPTSFTVRVLARLLSAPSRTKISVRPTTPGGNGPAIPPPSVANCSPDFTPGSTKDSDHDGLSDVLEHKLHTDPCNADTDGDGIGNWDELHGAFDVNHAKHLNYKPGLDWLDPDTDGDGIPDGADDQDHDGVSNLDEIKPPLSGTGYTIAGRPAAMSSNPLDPCDPDPQSVYCPLHPTS